MTKTTTQGRKQGKPKERSKDKQPTGTKKKRKLVPLVVGSYLTHGPSDVACMQITRSNNNESNLVVGGY
jgi:hypothetical protein